MSNYHHAGDSATTSRISDVRHSWDELHPSVQARVEDAYRDFECGFRCGLDQLSDYELAGMLPHWRRMSEIFARRVLQRLEETEVKR
jgi:hypothetical protein